MPSPNSELEITFLDELQRWPNAGDEPTILGTARNCESPAPFTIKGKAHGDDPQPRMTYRLFGYWKNYRHPRTGAEERQFHFTSFTRATPSTREAVIEYLAKEGRGLQVGPSAARTLWETFEADTCRIVREEPETALASLSKHKRSRVSLADMKALSERLQKIAHLEKATIDLTHLLAGRGFPKATPTNAIREWGNRAGDLVRMNPYLLMQLRGCGFKRCDALYLSLSQLPGYGHLHPSRLKRQAYCAWHAVASESEGSTWYQADVAVKGIQQNIGGTEARVTDALKLAIRGKLLAMERTWSRSGPLVDPSAELTAEQKKALPLWIAEERKAWSEKRLAELVAQGLQEKANWGVNFDGESA